MKYRFSWLLLTSLLSAAAMHVSAADVTAGKAKAGMCAGCHGKTGVATIPTYPNLAGQNTAYLEKQLKAFRDGSRKDPIMTAMSKSLTDADIANLSAFYTSLDN